MARRLLMGPGIPRAGKAVGAQRANATAWALGACARSTGAGVFDQHMVSAVSLVIVLSYASGVRQIHEVANAKDSHRRAAMVRGGIYIYGP